MSSKGSCNRQVLWRTQPKAASGLKRPPVVVKKPCPSSCPTPQENMARSSDFESRSPKSLLDFSKLQLEIPPSPTASDSGSIPSPSPKNVSQKKKKSPAPALPSVELKKLPSPQDIQAQRKSKIAHYGRCKNPNARMEEPLLAPAPTKKRCGWITSQSDAVNIAYHDQEWGVPVHDDRLLFELLILASAQSELSWSAILGKREKYRAAFAGFDPSLVARFTPANIGAVKASIDILQQDGKVQSVVENAQRVLQIVEEFGSLDKYIWGFFNLKPIATSFRMPSQVPVKSSRSEVISKDLIRRGFRGVAPAVVYSFMQAAGLTNDHLVTCFRHRECQKLGDEQQQQQQQQQQSRGDEFTGQILAVF